MSAKVLFLKSGEVKPPDSFNAFFNNAIPEEVLNKPVTFEQKKNVAEKVASLSKDAHLEIFFLLKNSGSKYTSNHNGIFFNINSVPDHLFNRLEQMVDFCYENEKKLAESYNKRFGSHTERSNKTEENSDESESSDDSSDESTDESESEEDQNVKMKVTKQPIKPTKSRQVKKKK